jgi:hypothetical protein
MNTFHLVSILTFKRRAKGNMMGSGDTEMDAGTPLSSPLELGGWWRGEENEVECPNSPKVVQPLPARTSMHLLLGRTAVRRDVRFIRTSRGVNW